MSEVAMRVREGWEPRVIKISSKRQVTIPAEVYDSAGFSNYAIASWTEEGLLIQPVKIDNEDDAVSILRKLVDNGLEGEALVKEFERWRKADAQLDKLIDEGLHDIEAGRIKSFKVMQHELRSKYGL